MRISDWSSDVRSSDLLAAAHRAARRLDGVAGAVAGDALDPVVQAVVDAMPRHAGVQAAQQVERIDVAVMRAEGGADHLRPERRTQRSGLRRVEDRECGGYGRGVIVRVELGCRPITK